MFVAELTQARDPRVWVARVRRKGRIGRLMNDPLGVILNWSRLTKMSAMTSSLRRPSLWLHLNQEKSDKFLPLGSEAVGRVVASVTL